MNFNCTSSGISAESSQQPSSSDALNSALDNLGLLSRVTESRQQYLQEKEQFVGCLEALSLADSSKLKPPAAAMPCPPCLPTIDQSSSDPGFGSSLMACNESSSNLVTERQHAFIPRIPCQYLLSSSSTPDGSDGNNPSGIEKENTLFSGFKTLAVNSSFLSAFKSEYSLPGHLSSSAKARHSFPSGVHDQGKVLQKDNIRNFIIRRRRLRTHPYENSERYSTLFEMCVNDSVKGNAMRGCYRLRTASLSSGVSGKLKPRPPGSSQGLAVPDRVTVGSVSPGLVVRSRSMEDLSGANASCTAELQAAVLRTKEVENVSRAIQQMCVQDSG